MNHESNTRRETSSGHLDVLDGWRGVAIALLLIGHFLPVAGINFARVGVNFFFVLSGLLMARILFVQHTPIPLFYRRRIARIVPAHLAFIVLVLVVWVIEARPIRALETASAALFVNNYVGVDGGPPQMPYGHIWSLSVEKQSYILLSLLALLARRFARFRRWRQLKRFLPNTGRVFSARALLPGQVLPWLCSPLHSQCSSVTTS